MSSAAAGRALERFLAACKDALLVQIRKFHEEFDEFGLDVGFGCDSELKITWTTAGGVHIEGAVVAEYSEGPNEMDDVATVYLSNIQILHLYLAKAKAGSDGHRKAVARFVELPETTGIDELDAHVSEYYSDKD